MTSRNALKPWFLTGLKPTQGQFAELINSCFNLNDDQITIAMVQGLSLALAGKASLTNLAEAVAAAMLRIPVAFANQQVFNFNAIDYPNLSQPMAAIFWAVMDDQPGFVEADKSTWVFKKIDFDFRFTQNIAGTPLVYTFDLGYAPSHGLYQLF